jgi:hypothetical protein
MYKDLINTQVLIRSADSGVHYGTLTAVADDGRAVRLKDSRRLWRWKVAGQGISLSEVAILGVDHAESKITMTLPDIVVSGVCEIIPTHGLACATIIGAPIAQAE